MKIPQKVVLTEGFYLTDGGTIVLLAEAPDATRHQITLAQRLLLEHYDPNLLPGRLYFNQSIVPVRSEAEAEIIALLQAAEIAEEPQKPGGQAPPFADTPGMIIGDDLKAYYAKLAEGKTAVLQHLRSQLVTFVNSEEYLKLAGPAD